MSSRLLSKLSGSAADQAMMSLVSFASSMALIRLASKSDYGLFVLFFSVIYLVQGIQNALVLSPYITRVSSTGSESKEVALYLVTRGLFVISIVSSAFIIISFDRYLTSNNIATTPYILLFFSLALFGWLARESTRAIQYTEGNIRSAVINSIVYASIVVCYLAYSIFISNISLGILFLAIGVAGISVLLIRPRVVSNKLGWRNELVEFLALGKWAIIGAVGAWVTGNYYPFFVNDSFDIKTVADIGASKLLVMPFALLIPAWSSIFRPMIGRWYVDGNFSQISKSVNYSTALIGGCLLIYSLLVFFFYKDISFVFGDKYSDLAYFVVAWCVYYLFFAYRTFCQSVLLCTRVGYKSLSLISLLSFFIFWPSLFFGAKFGPVGVIGSLIFVECFQSIAVWNQVRLTINMQTGYS